jgi:sodium/bile acid cotransporter 7
VKWGVWSSHGLSNILITLLGSVTLFFIVMFALNLLCKGLGFSEEDRIAAVFCGSKKTLASGVPMAQLIFGNNPALSLILLPIMIYHPLQLIICGILAVKWAERK